MTPPTPPKRLLDQVAARRYVAAPEAPTYRAIMHAFYAAKQRCTIQLRPAEVLSAVAGGPFFTDGLDAESLDVRLDQLVNWGNLTRSLDTAAVSRLEDFSANNVPGRMATIRRWPDLPLGHPNPA